MKLYLSSYYLGDRPENFSELFSENQSVAVIMNASDSNSPDDRPQYLEKNLAALELVGLRGEELDLTEYFENTSLLRQKLNTFGGVWVVGGNSFVLRRAMRQSSFDKIAPELIKRNELVYGGFSAGAIAATPTLRGVEIVDDPLTVPKGYDKDIVWKGLNLYDKSIVPHYRSNHPESDKIEEVAMYFLSNNMPYIALQDGQAITVKTP